MFVSDRVRAAYLAAIDAAWAEMGSAPN
jgi:hypothetical protein